MLEVKTPPKSDLQEHLELFSDEEVEQGINLAAMLKERREAGGALRSRAAMWRTPVMRSWLLPVASAAVLVMPLGAEALTYNVVFSGTGTLPSGTIVFANVGDLAPTAFSFSDGTSVWTQADTLLGVWGTVWAGESPVRFVPASDGIQIADTSAPTGNGKLLLFTGGGAQPPLWFALFPGDGGPFPGCLGFSCGSYAVTPEPTTLSLVALGALALGLRRRLQALTRP